MKTDMAGKPIPEWPTRRQQVEAIAGPAVAFYSAADHALAAAERAVIDAAVGYVTHTANENWNRLVGCVEALLRLRAARNETR